MKIYLHIVLFILINSLAYEVCFASCDDLAVQYALTDEFERSFESQQAFFEYKNGPNTEPETVDLGKCLISECVSPHQRKLKLSLDVFLGNLTSFEKSVLALKKGDTVVFDDKKYVLGDFLGSGNTTHIFALQNQEGAIRLPFLSTRHRYSSMNYRRELLSAFIKTFALNVAKTKNTVKLLEPPDPLYRYLVVEHIPGNLSGTNFLKALTHRELEDADSLHWPKDFTHLNEEETAQLMKLVEAMKLNNNISEFKRTNDIIIFAKYAKQYLLNDATGEWILVDIE